MIKYIQQKEAIGAHKIERMKSLIRPIIRAEQMEDTKKDRSPRDKKKGLKTYLEHSKGKGSLTARQQARKRARELLVAVNSTNFPGLLLRKNQNDNQWRLRGCLWPLTTHHMLWWVRKYHQFTEDFKGECGYLYRHSCCKNVSSFSVRCELRCSYSPFLTNKTAS